MNKKYTDQDWKKIYLDPYKTTRNMYLRYIQYQILCRYVPCRKYINMINVQENMMCTFCNNAVETISHLFVDCPKIKVFWSSINSWLRIIGYKNLVIKKELILFGIAERDITIKVIILCSKYIILKNQKKGQCPHIREVKFFLKKQLEAEEYMAKIRMNEKTFLGKWAHIFHELKNM